MSSDTVIPPTELSVGSLARFVPEPKSTLGSAFKKLFNTSIGAAKDLVQGTLDPTYSSLIQEQIQQQIQMQLVSLVSNTEKSKHETAMVPLRNLTVR